MSKEILFTAGRVIFDGYFPDDVERAKKIISDLGLQKADVRMYKKTVNLAEEGEELLEVTHLLIETLRPVVVECGVVGCSNHKNEVK